MAAEDIEWIYPCNRRKYCGTIYEKSPTRYCAQVHIDNERLCKYFSCEDDAEKYLMEKNVEYNLPIANRAIITKLS